MQLNLPIGGRVFTPKKGMTVRPIPSKKVPTNLLYHWETGMIYDTCDTDEGMLLEIRGISKGSEFKVFEYADYIEEMMMSDTKYTHTILWIVLGLLAVLSWTISIVGGAA